MKIPPVSPFRNLFGSAWSLAILVVILTSTLTVHFSAAQVVIRDKVNISKPEQVNTSLLSQLTVPFDSDVEVIYLGSVRAPSGSFLQDSTIYDWTGRTFAVQTPDGTVVDDLSTKLNVDATNYQTTPCIGEDSQSYATYVFRSISSVDDTLTLDFFEEGDQLSFDYLAGTESIQVKSNGTLFVGEDVWTKTITFEGPEGYFCPDVYNNGVITPRYPDYLVITVVGKKPEPNYEVVPEQDTLTIAKATKIQVRDLNSGVTDPEELMTLSVTDPTIGHFALVDIDENGFEYIVDSSAVLTDIPFKDLDSLETNSDRYIAFVAREMGASSSKQGTGIIGNTFSSMSDANTESRIIDSDTVTYGNEFNIPSSQTSTSEDYLTVQVSAKRKNDASIAGSGTIVVDTRTYEIRMNSINSQLIDGLYTPTDTVSVADTVLVEALASNRLSLEVEDQDVQVTLLLPQFVDGRFVLQSKSTIDGEWNEVEASDSGITVDYHSLDPGYEDLLRNEGEPIDFTRLLFVPGSIVTSNRYEILDMVAFDPERATHQGESFFIVDRYKLKLLMPPLSADSSYWPSIESTEHAHPDFDFFQVDNIVENMLLVYLNNGVPDTQQEISIEEKWVAGSGGHTHGGGGIIDPPLNSEARRYIFNKNSLPADSARGILLMNTDNDGEVRIEYKTPEMGGELLLTISTVIGTDSLMLNSDTIEVKVPGLVQLPDSSSLYVKNGGTSKHHGPPGYSDDDNHWVNPVFRDSLFSIAAYWRDYIDEEEAEDDNQRKLRINDISLVNGGLFDISGKWSISHKYHRVGRDVDIRTRRNAFDLISDGGVLLRQLFNPDGSPRVDEDGKEMWQHVEFQEIVEEAGGYAEVHCIGCEDNNEHYHIYFY